MSLLSVCHTHTLSFSMYKHTISLLSLSPPHTLFICLPAVTHILSLSLCTHTLFFSLSYTHSLVLITQDTSQCSRKHKEDEESILFICFKITLYICIVLELAPSPAADHFYHKLKHICKSSDKHECTRLNMT